MLEKKLLDLIRPLVCLEDSTAEMSRETIEDFKSLYEDINNYPVIGDTQVYASLMRHICKIENILSRLCSNDLTNKCFNSEILLLLVQYVKFNKVLVKYMQFRSSNEVNLTPPEYVFGLRGEEFSLFLEDKKEWLRGKIVFFNRTRPSLVDLKEFLCEVERIFSLSDYVLSDATIAQSIGCSPGQRYRSLKESRLTISIHDIFDSGLDMLVLGEAGAGKTTSLQMYAKKQASANNSEKLVLYIPLALVLSAWFNRKTTCARQISSDVLLEAIASYFNSIGVKLNFKCFKKIILSKKVTFLLDGLDEVVKQFEGVVESIVDLRTKYNKSQYIISSRMSGEYLSSLRILSMSLLPFTDRQRVKFISGWFGESKNKISEVLAHLKRYPEVKDLVSNPLLATILCVLAEHEVPLPDNEISLYEERMSLLLGHYDVHKKIYRLKSHHSLLEIVAQKIAYQLHMLGVRYASLKRLKSMAINSLQDKFYIEQVYQAVNELIDPCNVLVPMNDAGDYGFGHLRYQEYLAACELRNNRSIGVGRLMEQLWWRGALVLFSKMTDDISFLITWVYRHGYYMNVKDVLDEMIDVKPESERKVLRSILQDQLIPQQIDSESLTSYEDLISDISDDY